MILLRLGIGLAFMPIYAIATGDIAPQQSGSASATIVTAHEVGVAIGAALLSSVLAARVHSALSSAQPTVQQVVGATLRGYTDTLWWAVGGMLLASLIAGLMVMAKAPKDSAPKDSAPKDSGPKDNAPPVPSTGRRNPTPWP